MLGFENAFQTKSENWRVVTTRLQYESERFGLTMERKRFQSENMLPACGLFYKKSTYYLQANKKSLVVLMRKSFKPFNLTDFKG